MYAYCSNNPVNYVDHNGDSALALAALIALGVIALGTLTSCTFSAKDAYEIGSDFGPVGLNKGDSYEKNIMFFYNDHHCYAMFHFL